MAFLEGRRTTGPGMLLCAPAEAAPSAQHAGGCSASCDGGPEPPYPALHDLGHGPGSQGASHRSGMLPPWWPHCVPPTGYPSRRGPPAPCKNRGSAAGDPAALGDSQPGVPMGCRLLPSSPLPTDDAPLVTARMVWPTSELGTGAQAAGKRLGRGLSSNEHGFKGLFLLILPGNFSRIRNGRNKTGGKKKNSSGREKFPSQGGAPKTLCTKNFQGLKIFSKYFQTNCCKAVAFAGLLEQKRFPAGFPLLLGRFDRMPLSPLPPCLSHGLPAAPQPHSPEEHRALHNGCLGIISLY